MGFKSTFLFLVVDYFKRGAIVVLLFFCRPLFGFLGPHIKEVDGLLDNLLEYHVAQVYPYLSFLKFVVQPQVLIFNNLLVQLCRELGLAEFDR